MTYIQPNKKSLITKMLPVLIGSVVFAALWLVVLQNKIVDLEHGIIDARKELKALQLGNVELREKALTLFDVARIDAANESNLIQDKNPEYMEIQWSFASRY